MTNNPALTISLLNQLTDRELQSNYLNHLDRTSEIASLLTQITDRNLALRIINLAFEVDLSLGANLTASIAPELQQIIVNKIDRLEIPIQLKIQLWFKTNSKVALPNLKDILANSHNGLFDRRTINLVTKFVLYLDWNSDLALNLLIDALDDNYFSSDRTYHDQNLEYLTRLAPEVTEVVGNKLQDLNVNRYTFVHNSIDTLGKIGTPAAIDKIRNALHVDTSRWLKNQWIKGLGIVAEPAMVEHLIYLLHFSSEYIDRLPNSPHDDNHYAHESRILCCEVIEALEHIGGDFVFDILHQSLYWIDNSDEYPYQYEKIVEALFKIDRDRAFTSIEGAIHSHDSAVRKKAAKALSRCNILIEDRNLSILLDAIDDPEADVQLEIVASITSVGNALLLSNYDYDNSSIKIELDQKVLDQAYVTTEPILISYLSHPNPEIREKAIRELGKRDFNDPEILLPFLDSPNDENTVKWIIPCLNGHLDRSYFPILLKYLEDDRLEIRTFALNNLKVIGDDSILPILVSFLTNLEPILRESAVREILFLGSRATFPVLLELAANQELLPIVIDNLRTLDREEPSASMFEEFLHDPSFALHFLNIAESTLIEIIKNDELHVYNEIFLLGEISISDRAVFLIDTILKYGKCDEDEASIRALDYIGTDLAVNTMLEFLPDNTTLGMWIAYALQDRGKLGVISRLWANQCQLFSVRLADAIESIQKRERLYNPDFSDQNHPIFQPIDNLRRKILPS